MIRGDPDGRGLGPLSRDVLAVIGERTDEGEGLTREEAIEAVKEANAADEDRLWETADPDTLAADVRDVLDGLLSRGYLYEVEGELRVTDRNDVG